MGNAKSKIAAASASIFILFIGGLQQPRYFALGLGQGPGGIDFAADDGEDGFVQGRTYFALVGLGPGTRGQGLFREHSVFRIGKFLGDERPKCRRTLGRGRVICRALGIRGRGEREGPAPAPILALAGDRETPVIRKIFGLAGLRHGKNPEIGEWAYWGLAVS